MDRPSHLRVEHLETAFGIDVAAPRLSRWLPSGAQRQLAYSLPDRPSQTVQPGCHTVSLVAS